MSVCLFDIVTYLFIIHSVGIPVYMHIDLCTPNFMLLGNFVYNLIFWVI